LGGGRLTHPFVKGDRYWGTKFGFLEKLLGGKKKNVRQGKGVGEKKSIHTGTTGPSRMNGGELLRSSGPPPPKPLTPIQRCKRRGRKKKKKGMLWGFPGKQRVRTAQKMCRLNGTQLNHIIKKKFHRGRNAQKVVAQRPDS